MNESSIDPDETRLHRAVVYLKHEDILRAVQRGGQGYKVRAVFGDPVRESVGIIVEHPDIPWTEVGRVPYELNASVDMESRVIDGEVWTRPRVVISEPGE